MRRCSRPACPNRAVATLTYVYADSTAVVGPLAVAGDPHSWDLCALHALRITAPRGWELVRHPDIADVPDDDLTALLDAVTGEEPADAERIDADRLRRLGVADPQTPQTPQAHDAVAGPNTKDVQSSTPSRPGRPHLRVVTSSDQDATDFSEGE